MEALVRFVLRLLLVPLGAAAIAVGMSVMLIAHWHEIVTLAAADPDAQGAWFIAFVLAGPMLAFMISVATTLALLPAAIGVLIAEALAIRSWIYHAANGGLSAWIGWSLLQDMDERYRFLAEPKTMVAAGLAGGLVYWLVAGWTAGFWKPVFGATSAPA